MCPLRETFFFGLRAAEVDFSAEHLAGAEVAVGGDQLLRADEAERVVEVAGHEVLAAFTARESERSRAYALAASFVGQHAAIFVVGVGDDHQQTGTGAELEQCLPKASR